MRTPARHSQCERILRVLEDGRPHSAAEIHRISGFSRLNSRISELRKRGYSINCLRDAGKSGPEAYVYTLRGESSPSAHESRLPESAGNPLPPVPSNGGQLLFALDPYSRRVA